MRVYREVKMNPDVGRLSTKSMPICKLKTRLLLLTRLLPNPLVLHNRAFYITETISLVYQLTVYPSMFLFGMFAFLFQSTLLIILMFSQPHLFVNM